MKHLKKYNYFSINENWVSDAQEGLSYVKIFEVIFYHSDDNIGFERIFIPKVDR